MNIEQKNKPARLIIFKSNEVRRGIMNDEGLNTSIYFIPCSIFCVL